MKSDVIDYSILGDDIQAVEVELDPGEGVIAEAGAMNWMEDDIVFDTRMGDGTEADDNMLGKLFSAGKRALTGESLFMTHFTNRGSTTRKVGFSAPYPGKIIPVDLAAQGGEILCQKDGFLCAAKGTNIDIALTKRLGAGFFGGEGFILQRLKGNGMAFIHACGTIVKKELRGETLRIDTGCLVAFDPGLDYSIEKAGNLKSMFFGGEGFFLATISGTGTVWMQSLPFSRLAARVLRYSGATANVQRKGENSVLGALGNLMDGR